MTNRALVFIADASQDLETVSITDVLRRACVHVDLVSVGGAQVTLANGLKVSGDYHLEQDFDFISENEYDIVIVPGGMPGATNLANSPQVVQLLQRQQTLDKYYAAICAAPSEVLLAHGLLDGHYATGYPAFADKLGDRLVEQNVVVSGKCITSRGPGTALEFALCLVQVLEGLETAQRVAKAMLVEYESHL